MSLFKEQFGINFINASLDYDVANFYATSESAGFDLRADLSRGALLWDGENEKHELGALNYGVELRPGERILIKTGLRLALNVGYEAQVRSRSGLALKNGIVVANSPGTVDSDYADEIGVILLNTSGTVFGIDHGDRIAQCVIAEVPRFEIPTILTNADYETFMESKKSNRRGGFGSTGIN